MFCYVYIWSISTSMLQLTFTLATMRRRSNPQLDAGGSKTALNNPSHPKGSSPSPKNSVPRYSHKSNASLKNINKNSPNHSQLYNRSSASRKASSNSRLTQQINQCKMTMAKLNEVLMRKIKIQRKSTILLQKGSLTVGNRSPLKNMKKKGSYDFLTIDKNKIAKPKKNNREGSLMPQVERNKPTKSKNLMKKKKRQIKIQEQLSEDSKQVVEVRLEERLEQVAEERLEQVAEERLEQVAEERLEQLEEKLKEIFKEKFQVISQKMHWIERRLEELIINSNEQEIRKALQANNSASSQQIQKIQRKQESQFDFNVYEIKEDQQLQL